MVCLMLLSVRTWALFDACSCCTAEHWTASLSLKAAVGYLPQVGRLHTPFACKHMRCLLSIQCGTVLSTQLGPGGMRAVLDRSTCDAASVPVGCCFLLLDSLFSVTERTVLTCLTVPMCLLLHAFECMVLEEGHHALHGGEQLCILGW